MATLLVTMVFGQHIALPAFVILYLMIWGGYRWRLALAYGTGCFVFLVVMFDYLSPTVWYPALFDPSGHIADTLGRILDVLGL